MAPEEEEKIYSWDVLGRRRRRRRSRRRIRRRRRRRRWRRRWSLQISFVLFN
jgi:hypothetical protein